MDWSLDFFRLMTKKTRPIKIIIEPKMIIKIQNCFCCCQREGYTISKTQFDYNGPLQTEHPELQGEHVFVAETE